MFKVIKIGDTELEMVTTAVTAYYYKRVFDEDLLVFLNAEHEEGEYFYVAEQLAYIMNCDAKKEDMLHLSWETYFEWLNQFAQIDMMRAASAVIGFFKQSQKTASTPKKKVDQQSGE